MKYVSFAFSPPHYTRSCFHQEFQIPSAPCISSECGRWPERFTDDALACGQGSFSPAMGFRKDFLKNTRKEEIKQCQVIMYASSWHPHWEQKESDAPNVLLLTPGIHYSFLPTWPGLVSCWVEGQGWVVSIVVELMFPSLHVLEDMIEQV